MNWRPWVIASLLLTAVIVNSALIWFEEVAGPSVVEEFQDDIKDELSNRPFTARTRRENFRAFGLPDDIADKAADDAKAIMAKRKERLLEMLDEHASEVSGALCPGGSLPQRYAALSFLVLEKDEERAVVAWNTITYFEVQEWWINSLTPELYHTVELEEPVRPAGTAMVVSAVLLNREEFVLEGKSPWGQGLTSRWGMDSVERKFPEVRKKLIDYFALMHVLVEIANSPEGICGA